MQRYRLLSLLAGALVTAAPTVSAQTPDSAALAAFRWRTVGPANFDGRVNDIVGIPFPSKTFYVASAAGGVFKTTNAGTTFRPVFENERVASVGALAIAPSDTNQVWVGTGDPNTRNTIEPGGGIYKSTNGGRTWQFMGLKETQNIGRIQVNPTNPDIVFVAALGHAWDTNPERGLYRTTDGGKTWKLVKFISNKAGFVDVQIDPSNPNVIYATSWERIRGPYFLNSGGPGSGLWKSTDGGDTWTEIKGGGFPATPKGRISVAIARTNSNIVYALVEADSLRGKDHPILAPASDSVGDKPKPAQKQRLLSGLYRSEDGGKTWRWMNDNDVRPFYYSQVRVDPERADRVYFSSTPVMFSDDGGKTARTATGGIHVDHHAMWIDPKDGQHFIVGDDGGVSQTWDRGGNFDFLATLPIAQFYDVSFDFATPYNVCAGAQDNGGWCGPSRRKSGPVTNAYWFTISGGDGFYTAQDPNDPNIVWGESQGGGVVRTNLATGERSSLRKPTWRDHYGMFEDSILAVRGDTTKPATKEQTARINALRAAQKADSVANDMRFNWETPFFLSNFNPRIFYMGGNRVLKSMDRGDDLFPISPELSSATHEQVEVSLKTTGGITNDATGAETFGTVVALAESYLRPGWLYAGTDDGNVWTTQNDGTTWEKLNGRFPGLPKNVWVSRIEPSHFDTLTWYISFDNHRVNDFGVYLYATNDGGKTFHSIANNLPTGGPDWVHVIREDPFNRDLLFAGTSVGAFVSLDRGAHWSRFMSGLPTVPVYDLKVHPRDHELIAATFGRGIWIVPIDALEQMDATVASADAHLFKPITAYEYGQGPEMGASSNGEGNKVFSAPSPAYGANISYKIATGSREQVHLVITDAAGDTVTTLNGPGSAGVHTVTWNFRGKAPARAKLTPSEERDSVMQVRRAQQVLDSLEKSGMSKALVDRLREMTTSNNPMAFFGGGGGRGRGGAGGFQDRPAEGPMPGAQAGGRGRGGAGAGAPADLMEALGSDAQDIFRALRGPGRGGFGGGRGGQAPVVNSGDYLVTMTVGGKTYKQVLRVERVNGGDDAGFAFGTDDDHQ
ncbi:MAG TPA: hypothetical protein VG818_01090 [Gemmatimonadaceae bacterium]|nr:hypothetical protein [Gemmatimonadaceae bacterium]